MRSLSLVSIEPGKARRVLLTAVLLSAVFLPGDGARVQEVQEPGEPAGSVSEDGGEGEPAEQPVSPAEAPEGDGAVEPGEAEGQAADDGPEGDAETPSADGDASDEGPLEWLERKIDEGAGKVVTEMEKVLFFDPVKTYVVWTGGEEAYDDGEYPAVPLVVLWLIFGAVTFTLLMGFVNIRGFRHALDLVRGRYTDPTSEGEVSHFQALSAALSATVGLGNIAGVSYAVFVGGPGAVFWMVVAAFFGMTTKFVECTLGQKYRRIDADGRVSGGAMHYLSRGLAEMGLGPLGAVLSVLFCILCIGGSFGGGNMFQANQSYEAISQALKLGPDAERAGSMIYGVILAVLGGLVIIGGIRRIATTASRIVPFMCAVYVFGSLFIILSNFTAVPSAVVEIIGSAFSPEAVAGGFFGVLLIGVQRAAFSNEAGVGSAPIAHSAARTDVPIREGFVSLLEPFIDTMVVCTMTGLVVVITGVRENFQEPSGSELTIAAWTTIGSWFSFILAAATVLFAFSTLISWSYYGERCWTYLFGPRSTMVYKVIFLLFTFVGAVSQLGKVIVFSDMMILGMAFPNLLGCLLLSGKVRADLTSYLARLRAGGFPRFRG